MPPETLEPAPATESATASLYLRHPDIAPFRPETYERPRPHRDVHLPPPQVPTTVVRDMRYGDFFAVAATAARSSA